MRITIFLMNRCIGSGIHNIIDALIAANYTLVKADLKLVLAVIRDHYDHGRLLISICSGSFLLANAGLMNNRPALMHWNSEPHFRPMFKK